MTTLGALVTLWSLADEHADEDGCFQGYEKDDLEREIGLPGFLDALPSDWFSMIGETPQVPNYQEHNGDTAKRRALALRRKKKERELSRKKRDKSVTRDRDRDRVQRTENISKGKRFIEPTLQEVSEYCRSRNNSVDADQFIDFYASKGWMIGKNKMKDWRRAVHTWEKNNFSKDRPTATNALSFEGVNFDEEK